MKNILVTFALSVGLIIQLNAMESDSDTFDSGRKAAKELLRDSIRLEKEREQKKQSKKSKKKKKGRCGPRIIEVIVNGIKIKLPKLNFDLFKKSGD